MLNNDMLMITLRGNVRDLQYIATIYNVDMPAEFHRLRTIVNEADRETRDGLPNVTIEDVPTDVTKLPAFLRKAGIERAARREVMTLASALGEAAERESMRLALAHAPHVLTALVTGFNAQAAEFAEVAQTAPHEVTSYTTPDQFAEHATLLGLVDRLTMAAGFRDRMSQIIGEELNGPALVWTLLDPKPEASCGAVRQALSDHAETLPNTLEQWLTLNTLGVSMAGAGEATARAAKFAAALHAAGMMSEDRGVRDRTYGEALAFGSRL